MYIKVGSALKLINRCHQSSEFVEGKEQVALAAECSNVYY